MRKRRWKTLFRKNVLTHSCYARSLYYSKFDTAIHRCTAMIFLSNLYIKVSSSIPRVCCFVMLWYAKCITLTNRCFISLLLILVNKRTTNALNETKEKKKKFRSLDIISAKHRFQDNRNRLRSSTTKLAEFTNDTAESMVSRSISDSVRVPT